MKNLFKKLTGKTSIDCCKIEIKEVQQDEVCCEKKNDCCNLNDQECCETKKETTCCG